MGIWVARLKAGFTTWMKQNVSTVGDCCGYVDLFDLNWAFAANVPLSLQSHQAGSEGAAPQPELGKSFHGWLDCRQDP